MNPDQKPGAAPAPDFQPKFELLVMCAYCGQGIEAPLPTDRDAITLLLFQRGWFVSMLSAPGPEVPVLFGALCATCAPTVFPPPVLKAAEEHRKRVLHGAQVVK